MEIRIGVADSPKEISLKIEEDIDALTKRIEESLLGSGVLWFTDEKGKRVAVPTTKVAYIEIEVEPPARSVGFGR